MAKSSVVARVLNGGRLECQVTPPRGKALKLAGRPSDVEPHLEGSAALAGNKALVHNAWAFAKCTHLKVSLPTAEDQKAAEKRGKAHRELAEWISDLVDDPGRITKRGWCSACFADVDHRKVRDPAGPLPAYLCTNCGSATVPCAGPGCENMAVCGQGAIRLPHYCAEHRHEISGFEKSCQKIDTLDDYREFLEYDKTNLNRTTKLVGFGIAAALSGGAAAFSNALKRPGIRGGSVP